MGQITFTKQYEGHEIVSNVHISSHELSEDIKRALSVLEDVGYLEYRDYPYRTYQEYKEDNPDGREEESWMARNAEGTLEVCELLGSLGILDFNAMSWHFLYRKDDSIKEVEIVE